MDAKKTCDECQMLALKTTMKICTECNKTECAECLNDPQFKELRELEPDWTEFENRVVCTRCFRRLHTTQTLNNE